GGFFLFLTLCCRRGDYGPTPQPLCGTVNAQMENKEMKSGLLKGVLVLALAAGGVVYFSLELGQYFTLTALKDKEQWLRNYHESHPLGWIALFIGVYILAVALSLPIAAILTLAGGAVFGFWRGTVLV